VREIIYIYIYNMQAGLKSSNIYHYILPPTMTKATRKKIEREREKSRTAFGVFVICISFCMSVCWLSGVFS